MTKDELKSLAKLYFNATSNLKEIFGTEDGHFWYKEVQAQKYCNVNKVAYFKFLVSDFNVKTSKKKENINNG